MITVPESVRSSKARAIDDYIQQHNDATVKDSKRPYELNGLRKDLQVYRLPLSSLIYNIRNGRFAAELREHEATLARRLEPEKLDDALEIESLLLKDSLKAEFLRDDIKRVGQMDPGVITDDGAIIDGNRRVAVLRRLHEETGEARFTYFEAARLPFDVSAKDLWNIEAGIQLSVDLQASYGPINELMKIKEGIECGHSPRQVALVLGGENNEDTVAQKLDRLKLIESYLGYIGKDYKYSEAERKVEHFIDLQNIMRRRDWKEMPAAEKSRMLTAAFELIRCGVAHLRIREMSKLVKDKDARREFVNNVKEKGGAPVNQPIPEKELADVSIEDEIREIKEVISTPPTQDKQSDATQEEAEEENGQALPEPTQSKKQALEDILDDAVEKADAKEKRKRPAQMLSRVKNTLETLLELDRNDLQQARKEIKKVAQLAERLLDKIGE